MDWEWDESLSVGIGTFDDHHKKLLLMIRLLKEAEGSPNQMDAVHQVFNDLLDYSGYHFESEEKAMIAHGFPGHAAHKKEHDAFKAQMASYAAMLVYGSLPPASELTKFLLDWLENHVRNVDMEYAPFFKNQGFK